MSRIIGVIRFLAVLMGVDVLILLLLLTGPSLLADGRILDPASTSAAWIPLVSYDHKPTPIPTPSLPPSPYSAHLLITPQGGINASTFNPDSFIVRNTSTIDRRIKHVRIDLSSAVFPDMVFDPYGQGGDTLAKDLKVDHKGSTGFAGHRYEAEHGGGFDILELEFHSFDPGEEFRFSVDVDPNSIRGVGAPGPNESGSVSGLELLGSTITVTFEDGKVLANQTFRIPGSIGGSEAELRDGLPPAPQLSVRYIDQSPASVNEASQIADVSGPHWQPVTLLVLEGGLFLEGVPGGGYNVEPYDANSLVALKAYEAQIQQDGKEDIPLTLARSIPHAGINHLVAAFDNHFGTKGPASFPVKLELLP